MLNRKFGLRKLPIRIEDLAFLSTHGVTFVTNIILTILLANYLSVQEYVFYGQASSAVNFLIPLCSAGLVPFIIRHFQNYDNRDFDLGSITRTIYWGGCCLLLLILGASLLLDISIKSKAVSFAIYGSVVINAASILSNALQRAKRQSLRYIWVSVGSRLIGLGALLYFFMRSSAYHNVETYLMSLMFGTAVVLAVLHFRIFPDREADKSREPKALKAALHFTVPVMIASSISQSTPFFERTILSGTLGHEALSQYIFTSEIALKLLAVILLMMRLVVFPRLVSGNPERERSTYRKIIQWTLPGSFVLGALVLLASPFYSIVMGLFINDHRLINPTLFSIIGIFSISLIIQYIFQMGLFLTGRTSISLYTSAAALVLHLTIAPFAARWAGVEGVALSLIFAQVITLIACYTTGIHKYIFHKSETKLSKNNN